MGVWGPRSYRHVRPADRGERTSVLRDPKGKVYSLDAQSGCIHWVFDAGANVRTAITIGPVGDRWAAYFADNGATETSVYAVNAATGKLLWKTAIEGAPYAAITGAPVLAAGKLFLPVTGHEDSHAGNAMFECCRFRGSLLALEASTGAQQWGPSGAGIWSAPTVDLEKRVIYAATGDSHSVPATKTSDSILAFDMDTGAVLRSRQMSPGDGWNAACVIGDSANCPEPAGQDLDFASSPILVERRGKGRALVAGQKSGVVYALDPTAKASSFGRKGSEKVVTTVASNGDRPQMKRRYMRLCRTSRKSSRIPSRRRAIHSEARPVWNPRVLASG